MACIIHVSTTVSVQADTYPVRIVCIIFDYNTYPHRYRHTYRMLCLKAHYRYIHISSRDIGKLYLGNLQYRIHHDSFIIRSSRALELHSRAKHHLVGDVQKYLMMAIMMYPIHRMKLYSNIGVNRYLNMVYFSHIQGYFRAILGLFQGYFRPILPLFRGKYRVLLSILGGILPLFQGKIRYILSIFRYILSIIVIYEYIQVP